MANEKKGIWTIPELIQLNQEGCLDLPNVQRGFVWKPSQVENLWDSLLRRFPIGAFIVDEGNEKKTMLIDGQQRATSILLGFAGKALRTSSDDIRVFIDLRRPVEKEGRQYAFRVITRSHPWGYQRGDNTKTLEAKHKEAAAELWNIDDPHKVHLSEVYPYDAFAPFPLDIFTNLALDQINSGATKRKDGVLEERLLAWVKERKFYPKVQKETLTTWLACKKGQDIPKVYTLDDIYDALIEMIRKQQIPMLPMPSPWISGQDGSDFSEKAQPELNEESEVSSENIDDNGDGEYDVVEEVFIRLNSAGTPLRGEELNYSILKSKITKDLQDDIETACAGIMESARFITLAYRLYQQYKQKNRKSLTIDLRIKPKQFQREMQKKSEKDATGTIGKEFINFIQMEILNKDLLGTLKSILKYSGKDTKGKDMKGYDQSIPDYRLPYPLFVKIAAASQGEIIFLLMYRIMFGDGQKDSFTYDTDEHRHMVAIILLFLWHGKDSRSRYNKLLNKVWVAAQKLPFRKMWSNVLLAVAYGENELKPIPSNNRFLDQIRKRPRKDTKIWDKYVQGGYHQFIDNVMSNKDLLLFTQRIFISDSRFFDEALFRFDDTNIPFDWDHISPENYVKGRQRIPSPLKDIYQQPANLRAWPYSLNRADHDKVPAEKFDVQRWNPRQQHFIKTRLDEEDLETVNRYLLESSFCHPSRSRWSDFSTEWLITTNGGKPKISDDYWADVYALIFNRWEEMYNAFNCALKIGELVAPIKRKKMQGLLKNNMWKLNPNMKKACECLDFLYLPFSSNDDRICLFIADDNDEMRIGFWYNFDNDRLVVENLDGQRYLRDENPNRTQYWKLIYSNYPISCPYDSIVYREELRENVLNWLQDYSTQIPRRNKTLRDIIQTFKTRFTESLKIPHQ
jgi:hypothetical protein